MFPMHKAQVCVFLTSRFMLPDDTSSRVKQLPNISEAASGYQFLESLLEKIDSCPNLLSAQLLKEPCPKCSIAAKTSISSTTFFTFKLSLCDLIISSRYRTGMKLASSEIF